MGSSANSAAKRVHVVEWTIPITSAGTTVMNDDASSQMEDFSFLDLSIDRDEWELPMLSTDLDDSFTLVPPTAPGIDCQGPPHPLPKVKPHSRFVRPRVEPILTLQNGAPNRNDGSSSSTSRRRPQLQVSNLQATQDLPMSYPDVPKSVMQMSMDDLIPQPPPPGGRGAPISLRSGLTTKSLETESTGKINSESVTILKTVGQQLFHPPSRHQTGRDQNSATALVRTKQPSSNRQIVQLFQTGQHTGVAVVIKFIWRHAPAQNYRWICSFYFDEVLECSWQLYPHLQRVGRVIPGHFGSSIGRYFNHSPIVQIFRFSGLFFNRHIESTSLVAESGRHRVVETYFVCTGDTVVPHNSNSSGPVRIHPDSFVVCCSMGETCSHFSMPRTHGPDSGLFPGADLGFTTV